MSKAPLRNDFNQCKCGGFYYEMNEDRTVLQCDTCGRKHLWNGRYWNEENPEKVR